MIRTVRRTVSALAVLASIGATAAAHAGTAVITQWNFNGPSATTVPGGNLSPTPSVGTGLASLIGGVTAEVTFGSGAVNGGSSDPAGGAPPNYGWQTTTYAATGTESGLRGVQFNVSTVGYQDIIINWDQRHSNTSSRFVQFLYSLDGTSFTNAGLLNDGVFVGAAGDTWFNNRTVSLTSIAGAADNPNFAFRIVAIFDPNGTNYVASNTTSNYAGGTWRFDMVGVSGSAIPAPGALALLGLAGAFAAPRRRR
jgi:hypothetical protein